LSYYIYYGNRGIIWTPGGHEFSIGSRVKFKDNNGRSRVGQVVSCDVNEYHSTMGGFYTNIKLRISK